MVDHFQYWNEGLTFIALVLVIVGVPCTAVAILGTRLINAIGQYPTRSARLQIGICLQLLAVEIVSFLAFAAFFKVFAG